MPILTLVIGDGGGVNLTPSGTHVPDTYKRSYPLNTWVSIAAIPFPNYQFKEWGGACSGCTGTTCTIQMTEDKTVSAVFEFVGGPTVKLIVSVSGNGSAVPYCPSPTGCLHTPGDQQWLQAFPGDGYEFEGWTGDIVSIDNPVLITMDTDKSITANFIEAAVPPQGISGLVMTSFSKV